MHYNNNKYYIITILNTISNSKYVICIFEL